MTERKLVMSFILLFAFASRQWNGTEWEEREIQNCSRIERFPACFTLTNESKRIRKRKKIVSLIVSILWLPKNEIKFSLLLQEKDGKFNWKENHKRTKKKNEENYFSFSMYRTSEHSLRTMPHAFPLLLIISI